MNKLSVLIVCLMLAPNIISSQNLTDSLKAHFKFDESLVDETAFHNDLELETGTIAYSAVTVDDKSL